MTREGRTGRTRKGKQVGEEEVCGIWRGRTEKEGKKEEARRFW